MTTIAVAAKTAEKMDRQYRFQRHIYDSTRSHYLLWRRRLIKELDPPNKGTVVEIACGTGWNIVHAARAYPHATFYGFDISSQMLITARASLRKNNLESRVSLAEGDATNFNLRTMFGLSGADRIFISYALSMIPDWTKALECAVHALNPGGSLHVVDFGTMERLPHAPRWALRRFLNHYNVTPRQDFEKITRAIATEHGLDVTFQHSPHGYSAYAVLKKLY